MANEQPNEASIFNSARKIESTDERDAFLAVACGNDGALRQRVEKLLAAYAEESQYLEQPAPGLEQTVAIETPGRDRAALLDAGLATAFYAKEAVVLGEQNHSVLKMLGRTLDSVPRVALRDDADPGGDPIVRQQSPEIPKSNSDSRYQLQGEIARGGMGAILKGRDTDLGRDLAIKVLLDAHKDNPQVIQRFIEEAQIGGQLQHPGIAPVYELGQFADQRPFFSMKLVKGETLSKLLADRKDAADERGKFIGIFEQVCQTMAYAHSRGVIHRDLKPANIMVGAFGEVQVMDWGLAKVLPTGGVADEKSAKQKQQGQSIIQTMRSMGSDAPGSFGSHGSSGSETQMGSVMGTPAYMPPEQALGEIDQMDQRADVFGLGAILAEILTGRPPYVGDDGTQVYRLASRGKLDDCFARLDACGADHDLISLTKHCLELEPADRPKDAGALAQRVTEYQDSVETKLRETELQRATEAARVVEQKKRLRVTIALAAAVVMLLLGGGSFAWWQNQQAQLVAQREARNSEAVSALVDQCNEAIKSGDTANAAIALDAAIARAEEGGAENYSARLQLLGAELQLLEELDELDQIRWTWTDSQASNSNRQSISNQRLYLALAQFGVNPAVSPTKEMILRVKSSGVEERVVNALDKLLLNHRTSGTIQWLRLLDENAFRDKVRAAIADGDTDSIVKLAQLDEAAEQPASFASILGEIQDIPNDRRRQLLQLVIRKQPSRLRLLMALGDTYGYGESVDEKLRWSQAAVAAAPNNAAAYTALGNALKENGEYESALAVYQKVIDLAPELAIGYANVALTLSEVAEFIKSIPFYEKATSLDSSIGAECHNNLGYGYEFNGETERAMDCYRIAIKLAPQLVEARKNLARSFTKRGDYDAAVVCYEEVIKLDPDDAGVRFQLGIALLENGDSNGAMENFRAAVERAPDQYWVYNNTAWSLVKTAGKNGVQPHVQQAVEWARAAVELSLASDGGALNTLGISLYRARQWQDACDTLLKSVAQGLDKPSNWLFLAMANWQLEEKDKAQEWYDKSLAWKAGHADELQEDAELQGFFGEAATRIDAMDDRASVPDAGPKSNSEAPAETTAGKDDRDE